MADIAQIESLFEMSKGLTRDAEPLSHWARYICVRMSGLLETAIEQILLDYCKTRSNTQIQSAIAKRLFHFQNPKVGPISGLLAEFSSGWSTQFDASVTDAMKEAINSIVGNRHRIAHGETSSLTLVTAKRLFAEQRKVIALLEVVCT